MADVPAWVKARKAALPSVRAHHLLQPLLPDAHIQRLEAEDLHVVSDFRLWIATLDGTRHVPDMTGVTAVSTSAAGRSTDGSWAEPPGPA